MQEDHENAQRLAKGLGEIEGVRVKTAKPELNMVFFDVSGLGLDNRTFLTLLKEHGVSMGEIGGVIRAVTHLDVSHDDIETTINAIKEIARGHAARKG